MGENWERRGGKGKEIGQRKEGAGGEKIGIEEERNERRQEEK